MQLINFKSALKPVLMHKEFQQQGYKVFFIILSIKPQVSFIQPWFKLMCMHSKHILFTEI